MKECTQVSEYNLKQYKFKKHIFARLVNEPRLEDGLVYTPAEIAQQPYLWRITAASMKDNASRLKAFLEKTGLYNKTGCPQIIFTGAGTSDFVGLSLIDLFRTTFKTGSENWPTPRITANPDEYFVNNRRYILIHFARSGNSPESKAVLNLALKKYPDNVHHIVITCNQDGDLAKISLNYPEKVFLITLHEATNDKGLAMTSSFSSMVVAGQAIAHLDDMDNYQMIVEDMATSAEYFIDNCSDDIYDLANPAINRAFFLGNKDLLGAATESSLKVQELTAGQLLAQSEDTMSFRHGPISAVDRGSLVCFFLSETTFTRQYEMDVIKQYNKTFNEMGAITVVIGSNNNKQFQNMGIVYLQYNPENKWNIPKYFQVNLGVLFGQLYGLFQAYRRGINVDDPSTQKAIYNRVVQGVQLYEEQL